MTPAYLTARECAACLGVSLSQVYKQVRAGVIPTSPLTGGAIRIPASALTATTTPPAPPQPTGRRAKIQLPKGYVPLVPR